MRIRWSYSVAKTPTRNVRQFLVRLSPLVLKVRSDLHFDSVNSLFDNDMNGPITCVWPLAAILYP